MNHPFRNILAIAKNTFRETMRDRILLSALVVVIAIIVFSLFIGSISIEQSTRVVVDFGVTAIYLLQVFVAIFIGSMLIYKEIERKTFFLIIPKPITRSQIILGKCLGLTATTFIVTLVSTVALCIILLFKGGAQFFLPIALSMFLSTLEASLLILISILFSSIASPILAAIFTFSIYIAGHASESVRIAIALSEKSVYPTVLKGIYYLLPNLEKFNMRNAIVYGDAIHPQAILYAILYALLYGGLLFFIANILFRKKEF